MNITLISNLYPNKLEPTKGVFIKQLAERLNESHQVTVISPVPWRPAFLTNADNSVPAEDKINNIKIYYPRYLVIPKILRSLTATFFNWGIKSTLSKLKAQGLADIVSAHWVYPDGVGSLLAAKKLNLPVTLHALGCDINEYTKYFLRRRQIVSAMNKANANVVKSNELKSKLVALGVNENKISVILNGVDKNKFQNIDQTKAREKLDLDPSEKYVIFIGNFQIEKGLNHLLDAVHQIKDRPFKLLVVGDGRLKTQVEAQIKELSISDKVQLVGRVSHEMIPVYMSAANLLCLPSLREGCPNVVIESLTCGTPVVASKVGAVPDMITNETHGKMVEPANSQALAEAIDQCLDLKNSSTLNFEWYSWEENAEKISQVFNASI
ncbi:glycosyltransferase [Aliikangiella coralliicola]|uniref:Glycosyltransferase family 4 protein n=1 Tax=Aliikangiella coralliicola TaxID=2592383 RepID=A0A545UHE8_9GAMM|nr:glycosyltransferase [Aliikangiella coralliicola]TQV88889.1 glycosyltransferase family 4 protein [Aliikangiella coralliicola]